jgi:hypothetical protein
VHRGVLQVCTAGAGTAHRMPEGIEYLHFVQAALDQSGLRYQVIDVDGAVRETLAWPFVLPAEGWQPFVGARNEAPLSGGPFNDRLVAFRLRGRSASADDGSAQTFVCSHDPGVQPSLWIGLRGREQRLAVIIGPDPGRSPHYWHGPALGAQEAFDVTVLLHTGMGPGGILCRSAGDPRWSTLAAASPWGAERLTWPRLWSVGQGARGADDQPFRGVTLGVAACVGEIA